MNPDIVRKLKALLRREGRTEEECDTAQIIAAALAQKHGIDIQDLDQSDPERPVAITHKCVGEWARMPDEATFASLICKRWFEVLPLHRSGFVDSMVFIGTGLHIEIAEYVFSFLVGEFRRCWNRRKTRSKARKAFIYGDYQALFVKLSARFPDTTAPGRTDLVLSLKAKRESYMAENFGATNSSSVAPKSRRSVAAQHGWRAGREIEIRPGVGTSPVRAGLNAGPRLIGPPA